MGNVTTALCSGSRDRKRMGRKSQNEKNMLLRDNQVGVVSLVIVNWILAVLVVIASIVPDFALGGPPGSTTYPHVIWAAGGMAVTLFVLLGQGFNVNVNAQQLVNFVRASIIVIILAAVAAIVHGILSLVEVVQCTSALCLNTNSPSGFAFLVINIVACFVFALLYLWLWWRSVVFARNVEMAIATGWVPGVWEDEEEVLVSSRMTVPRRKKRRPKY